MFSQNTIYLTTQTQFFKEALLKKKEKKKEVVFFLIYQLKFTICFHCTDLNIIKWTSLGNVKKGGEKRKYLLYTQKNEHSSLENRLISLIP